MSERDVLIERLEKKLIEKEREISELRKMLSEKSDFNQKFESIKQAIVEDVRTTLETGVGGEVERRISEIESKIVELRRAVESLMNEVVYIKNELREIRGGSDTQERRIRIMEKVGTSERERAKRVETEKFEAREKESDAELLIDGETYEKLKEENEDKKNQKNFKVGKLINDWDGERRKPSDPDDDLIVCG